MFKTEHSHVSPFYSIIPHIILWRSENKEVTWSDINSSFFHLKFPDVLLITPYFWRRKHVVHQNHRGAIGAVHVGPLWCLGPLGLLDLPFWWGLLCDQRLGRRCWTPGWRDLPGGAWWHQPQVLEKFLEIETNTFSVWRNLEICRRLKFWIFRLAWAGCVVSSHFLSSSEVTCTISPEECSSTKLSSWSLFDPQLISTSDCLACVAYLAWRPWGVHGRQHRYQ